MCSSSPHENFAGAHFRGGPVMATVTALLNKKGHAGFTLRHRTLRGWTFRPYGLGRWRVFSSKTHENLLGRRPLPKRAHFAQPLGGPVVATATALLNKKGHVRFYPNVFLIFNVSTYPSCRRPKIFVTLKHNLIFGPTAPLQCSLNRSLNARTLQTQRGFEPPTPRRRTFRGRALFCVISLDLKQCRAHFMCSSSPQACSLRPAARGPRKGNSHSVIKQKRSRKVLP